MVDRRTSVRSNRRVDGRRSHRAAELDAVGGLGERRHELERFQHIVCKLRRTAEASIFDWGKHEVKAEVLGERVTALIMANEG